MKNLIGLFLILTTTVAISQNDERYETITIDGHILRVLIVGNDTIPVVDMEEMSVSSISDFSNKEDRKRYMQMRHYAIKVYPYAAEAIKIYRETQKETEDMRKGKRKRYNRKKEKTLSAQYEKELKGLTKMQGYILVKMIERELGRPFYDVIKELRGGWSAFKWQSLGRWYGFNLRKGYKKEEDEILELILQDLNISYQ